MALAYLMIKLAAEKLLFCVYSALQSMLGFGWHIVDSINNYTLCLLESLAMEEIEKNTFQQFLSFFFTCSSFTGAQELLTLAFESFEYLWGRSRYHVPIVCCECVS